MRKAKIRIHNTEAGILTEYNRSSYSFQYLKGYEGVPASLIMPVREAPYEFNSFPPYFDGLLPEGIQLEGLLKIKKIDKSDYFSQLVTVGGDLVGAVTVEEMSPENE